MQNEPVEHLPHAPGDEEADAGISPWIIGGIGAALVLSLGLFFMGGDETSEPSYDAEADIAALTAVAKGFAEDCLDTAPADLGMRINAEPRDYAQMRGAGRPGETRYRHLSLERLSGLDVTMRIAPGFWCGMAAGPDMAHHYDEWRDAVLQAVRGYQPVKIGEQTTAFGSFEEYDLGRRQNWRLRIFDGRNETAQFVSARVFAYDPATQEPREPLAEATKDN